MRGIPRGTLLSLVEEVDNARKCWKEMVTLADVWRAHTNSLGIGECVGVFRNVP